MRNIFLPELLSIRVQNYSLYPNDLDYYFEFVKGYNLILGGNGMGKTTFVSLIKYGLIGNYKKQYEYTRTYKENKIEKRERHPDDFFKNRIDPEIEVNSDPTVTLNFKVRDTVFSITRGLKKIGIEQLFIDGEEISGSEILESKFESLKKDLDQKELSHYLPSIFETRFEKIANISFDDLIFFVNYILFFGEDHKTILWDEDVQRELFNTFFNSPELNVARQEAEREGKYFDSRARHKSEDKRAIRKVLDKIENRDSDSERKITDLIELKEKLERLDKDLEKIHKKRKSNQSEVSILESEKNSLTHELDTIETKRNELRVSLSYKEYNNQHKLYPSFLKNIQANHVCPLCNAKSEVLHEKVLNNPDKCWACDNDMANPADMDDKSKLVLESMNNDFVGKSNKLKVVQEDLKATEEANKELDKQFRDIENQKRKSLILLREMEFEKSQENSPSELQPFYEELEKLTREQEEFSKKSEERKSEARRISQEIEDIVLGNVQSFSSQFAIYAQKFLGVKSNLTYEKFGNDELKKFYPVINGTVRMTEYELSESQRFFIDHSFRMSILTHFYRTPTFYIVETPDSSLDLSYEKNAADVFSSFLEKPYSLILTSNLNNSSFINYITENKDIECSVVPLFEIAKKSVIQKNNITLEELYKKIKNG